MAIDKLVDSTQLDADLTSVANAIRTKGGTSAELAFPQGFIVTINNIEPLNKQVLEDDVIFIDDYAQAIVYSYSAEDFLLLEEMPPNPSHKEVESKGWNWTLADAKAHIRNYGELVIGQEYCTIDKKTHWKIEINNSNLLNYNLSFQQSEAHGVEINWGDGSPTETVSGHIGNSYSNITHLYANCGFYDITFSPINENITYIVGNRYPGFSANNGEMNCVKEILCGPKCGLSQLSYYACAQCVKKITMFGDNVNLSSLNLGGRDYRSFEMKFLTIPNGTLQIGNAGYSSLRYISLPNGLTTIGNNFGDSGKLYRLTPPNTVTNPQVIKGSAYKRRYFLQNCTDSSVSCANDYNLEKVIVKRDIAALNNNAFYVNGSYGRVYDFTCCTSVPTLPSTGSLGGIHATLGGTIYVPKSLEQEWKTATNWSSFAQWIVGV